MKRVLSNYYRLATDALRFTATESASGDAGFFRLGAKTICYGRCQSGVALDVATSDRYDASKDVHLKSSAIDLPFSSDEVIENLQRERYYNIALPDRRRILSHEWVRKAYYFVRELLPVSVRRHLQRAYFRDWQSRPFPTWPVDFTVDTLHEEFLRLSMEANGIRRVPFIWFWPEGVSSCLIMTHDVETSAGRDFTPSLMDLDDSCGIKASFQVIPEKRYEVPDAYVNEIRNRGFEFNIHDLNHDGFLFRERQEFLRRAGKINEYIQKYQARGFRAGAMYRNADWYDAFEFSYDMSVPNVAHLEPQRGGCCTVMPFFLGKILELPLTATQDYSLFNILNTYSLDLWKKQVDLIRARHGLMSFIVHPDYVIERRARKSFEALLQYLGETVSRDNVWAALPGDVDHWWRARSEMKLVGQSGSWAIEGPGKEKARIAYAVLDGDRLTYEVT